MTDSIADTIRTYAVVPHDPDLERTIIGAFLVGGGDAVDAVTDIITPDCFHDEHNRRAYEHILDLHRQGNDIDVVTVCHGLPTSEAVYIAGLTQNVHTASNVETYAVMLADLQMRKRMLDITCNTLSDILGDRATDEIVEQAEREIRDAYDHTSGANTFTSMKDGVRQSLERMSERCINREKGITATGIPTGLRSLDALTGGFQNSEVTILAARPAMGKSALMLHFARYAAYSQKHALIFSLEMSTSELVDRMMVAVTGVPAESYKRGELNRSQVDEVMAYADQAAALTIHIDDESGANIAYIRRKAKKMKNRGLCDIIFVDYLQLISPTDKKNRNRENEVAEISRELKVMAKQLSVPVVALAQLSRACEARADKRPMLSDLRDSGSIEQDADSVMFIYRESYYNENADRQQGEILLRKNRNGRTGTAVFNCNESLTKFYDNGY